MGLLLVSSDSFYPLVCLSYFDESDLSLKKKGTVFVGFSPVPNIKIVVISLNLPTGQQKDGTFEVL